MNSKKLATCLILALSSACAMGAETGAQIPDCAGITDVKSKSRPLFEGKTLMSVLLILEAKGEAGFHPAYEPPASLCVFETFDVAGAAVQAIHAPWSKDLNPTLLWRFVVTGPEARELLVLYDGTAAFVAKKDVFYVVEERKGAIAIYAMFRDQPTFAALKPVAISIIDGSAQPLAVVRWPPGAAEPLIEDYDIKRLK